MAHSYKWHTKKRRLETAWLQIQLDQGVKAGVLYRTDDGKYGLAEWLKKKPDTPKP